MRVGVDGRALRASRERRGVGVYLEQLLRELARLHPEDEYRVLVPGVATRWRAARERGGGRGTAGSGRALHGAAALAGRPRLDRLLGGPELVWAPAPAPLAVSRRHALRAHGARPLVRRTGRATTAATSGSGTGWPARDGSPGAHSGCSRTRTRCARSCSTSGSCRRSACEPCGSGPDGAARRGRGPARAARAARRTCSPSAASSRASSPRCSWRRTGSRVSAGSRPGSCSWATVRCAASSRMRVRPCSAGVGDARARRRLRRRALPRVRLARGGLRLHAARGDLGRRSRRGLRPARVPRDARRRRAGGPARTTPRRWPTRCCGWSASRSCANASSRPGASASELLSWERAARETRAVFEEALR